MPVCVCERARARAHTHTHTHTHTPIKPDQNVSIVKITLINSPWWQCNFLQSGPLLLGHTYSSGSCTARGTSYALFWALWSYCVTLSLIIFASSKHLPFQMLIWGKRKTSHRVMSGEYGDWCGRGVWWLANNCCWRWTECLGVSCDEFTTFLLLVSWFSMAKLHNGDFLVLLNENAGLQFGLVKHIHGAQYLLGQKSDKHHLCLVLNLVQFLGSWWWRCFPLWWLLSSFGVITIHHFLWLVTLFLKEFLSALHIPANQRLQPDGVSALLSTGVGQTLLTHGLCPYICLKLPGMIQKKFIVSLWLPKWLVFILFLPNHILLLSPHFCSVEYIQNTLMLFVDMHPSLKQQIQSKTCVRLIALSKKTIFIILLWFLFSWVLGTMCYTNVAINKPSLYSPLELNEQFSWSAQDQAHR